MTIAECLDTFPCPREKEEAKLRKINAKYPDADIDPAAEEKAKVMARAAIDKAIKEYEAEREKIMAQVMVKMPKEVKQDDNKTIPVSKETRSDKTSNEDATNTAKEDGGNIQGVEKQGQVDNGTEGRVEVAPKLSTSLPPSTRANTPAELRSKLGAGYDALVESGKLRIVATQKEAQRIIDMMRGGVSYSRGGTKYDSFDDLVKDWKEKFETLFTHERDNGDIAVSSIIVKRGERGNGIGTAFMKELIAYADSTGKRIVLSPGLKGDLSGTTSRGRLVKFYKRFGFVENKGRHKDFRISEGMFRDSFSDNDIIYSEDGKTIQGFASNGISYLVEDGIAGGKAWSVLTHELGVHVKKALQSDPRFKMILNSIEARRGEAGATGDAIRAAIKTIPKDTKPENRQEEMLAYLIENHPDTSIVRRIIALIKNALVKMGFKDVSVFTVADLRAMAEIAVRREAKKQLDLLSEDGVELDYENTTTKNRENQGRNAGSQPGYSLRDSDRKATTSGNDLDGMAWQVEAGTLQPGRNSSTGRINGRIDLSQDVQDLIVQFSTSNPFQKVTAKMLLGYNFKNWFGRSILRDQQTGKPYILYNGSTSRFSEFDENYIGSQSSSPASGLGFFMTAKKELAEKHSQGIQVLPLFVRLENPYMMKLSESQNLETLEQAKALRKQKEKEGYDGIIIQTGDIKDNYYIPFTKFQMKSAVENTGEFSRENADIYFSESSPPPIGSTQEELAVEREKAYQANRAQNRDLKRKAVRNVRSALGKMSQGVDKYLGAISTRLRNISPKLEARLRKLDFDTATNLAADNKAVLPLLQKAKKMSANDFADWDRARKNGDTEKINELVKKYDLSKEYAAYRETLNNLRDEANEVGLDISFIKEYAPRVIKDAQGFLNAVGKGDMRPVITDALNRRADQMGITVAEMSPEQKADIISQMLFGGFSGIGRPGNAKERTIKEIPVELDQYYMDSDGALVHYLHSIRKNVEIRKFFGKVSTVVAKAKGAMRQAESRLRKALAEEEDQYATLHQDHKKGQPFPESDRINGIRETIAEYKNILDKYNTERGYAPFISEYVLELMSNGTIDPIKNPEAEQILVNIMQARFHEKGTHGIIQAYKNFSYIDTMGSPFSAITQIGDLAWTIYENGWYRTAKAALGSVTKKSRITKEDVGIERIAQEFADSDTMSKAVAKVFKWVGLEKMDAIGKESFLNAALERFEDQEKKNPEALKKKISDIFEDETDNVIDDLRNKRITDNVKLLVYSNLLDFQPAALSEQSEQYLKAGNGRVFYMLKSYTLKQFDVFRREVYNTYKNGDSKQKIEAIRNMVYLAALIAMANAGADEIKDLLLGRKTSLEDRVTDNILRLFGVSKYITWQARTDGAGTAAAKQILPPFKFANAFYKDAITSGDGKGLEMVSSIPVVGKLAYWHMGRGSYNNKDYSEQKFSDKKRTLNSIKDKVEADPKLRGKYIKELAQLKAVNKVQARMNEQTKRINKLKASEKLTGRDNSKIIENLEKQRIKIVENYLQASK